MKTLKQIGIFLLVSLVLAAATFGTLDYTGIIDMQPLLDWMTLQSGELATIGFSGSAVTIGTIITKVAVTKLLTQSKNDNRAVLTEVLNKLDTVETQNAQILAYDKIMAVKNIEGRVLTDGQKSQLSSWVEDVEPGFMAQVLDAIPEEVKDETIELVKDKADEVLDIIKKRL